mgnify:FL=1
MTTRTLEVERSTSTAHRLAYYDGVCGNIHGHNMEWEVEVEVSMAGVGDDNMPLDLKDISGLIDEVDHAVIFGRDDELLRFVYEHSDVLHHEELDEPDYPIDSETQFMFTDDIDPIGEVFVFAGDPTCEVLSQWMADRLVNEIKAVTDAEVTVYETDKYGISTSASGCTCGENDACDVCGGN